MIDNHLLEKLSGSLSADLRRRLQPFDFVRGDVLAEPDAPIEKLIFPRSGLISIVVEVDAGDQIEAGLVGRRGVLGGAAVLGSDQHLHTAISQLSGRAWSMRVVDARELASTSSEFRRIILAHDQYLLAQARQFAACNAKHRIMQRLCSWLARVHEEAGGGELLMTQDNLAKMMGVQRATLSMLASELQENDLISYRRGRVRISDSQGLKDRACTCFQSLEARRERISTIQIGGRSGGADGRRYDGPAEGPPPD